MSAWTDHVAKWRDCQLCPLAQQRGNIVIARGSIPADVVFCGEAPGASEDALGQPFVGPAGQLLDQIIERALPKHVDLPNNCWRPLTYAMTNLVCCFPRDAKNRGDNEPETSEIIACRPRLKEFVALAKPRLVITVGTLATAFVDWDGLCPTVSIDHPAYILRMPLAQKGMAIQHTIVIIRTAVDDMLQCNQITNGNNNAYITSPDQLRTVESKQSRG